MNTGEFQFRELLDRSAQAGLALQRPDGSMPSGKNGPYGHPESPVRCTSHWLVQWAAALERDPAQEEYASAITRAAHYLLSPESLTPLGNFQCRNARDKDACNGLIGPAWAIEGLAAASKALNNPAYARGAMEVVKRHPFHQDIGLWQRVETDGSQLSFDLTFNHQLWFAACASCLCNYSGEVRALISSYLDRLAEHLQVDERGYVRHEIPKPEHMAMKAPSLKPRLARTLYVKLVPKSIRKRRVPGRVTDPVKRGAGYHAFNLHALGMLADVFAEHSVWKENVIQQIWETVENPAFEAALEDNVYGSPYNPAGFEIAYAASFFAQESKREKIQRHWLNWQVCRHWNPATGLMDLNCPDPVTLAARLYEGVTLSELPVSRAIHQQVQMEQSEGETDN